ncbi:hypothetical protein [Acinetobacter proteolyticus]|uniref:hypothetical protein n=1 Tax=Acinetobacter proteolyticus TaxID=1776741 RepID=UPI0031CDE056
MIDKNIELNIYKTVDLFLKCMNEKDKNGLLSDFEVTLKMYQELEGVLNNYFDGDYKLSLIPFDEVHLQEVENMPIFELNEMDDGEYVLECAVYNYEKDTSLILQGNVDLTNGNVHFFDPLFKS